jgi:hypothetical protein
MIATVASEAKIPTGSTIRSGIRATMRLSARRSKYQNEHPGEVRPDVAQGRELVQPQACHIGSTHSSRRLTETRQQYDHL